MAPRKKTMAAPADLRELDELVARQTAGVVVDVYNMDGRSPLGFGILVAGPDSEQATEARNRMQDEIQAMVAADDTDEVMSAARETVELSYLARISKEFIGAAKLDGKLLENKEQDFLKLYRRFRFIKVQVDRAHYDRSRFLPEPAVDSPKVSAAQSEDSGSAVQPSESEPGTSSGD